MRQGTLDEEYSGEGERLLLPSDCLFLPEQRRMPETLFVRAHHKTETNRRHFNWAACQTEGCITPERHPGKYFSSECMYVLKAEADIFLDDSFLAGRTASIRLDEREGATGKL